MADQSQIEEILARQREEQERINQAQRHAEEATRLAREVEEAFDEVHDCVKQHWSEEVEYYTEFARRLTRLARLLASRNTLEQLLDAIPTHPPFSKCDYEPYVRVVVVHLMRSAAAGEIDAVAGNLREAADMPFAWLLSDWLRVHLRRVYSGRTLTSVEDGICWPHLLPDEPAPLNTLEQACLSALNAIEHPPTTCPTPQRIVKRLWELLLQAANRVSRTPPEAPTNVYNAADVRSAVSVVRAWVEGVRQKPNEPVAEMRAEIANERMTLELLGSSESSSWNWQSGVDRLWQRWRSLFPLVPPPPRPSNCLNYQGASDGVDALLRALETHSTHTGLCLPSSTGGSQVQAVASVALEQSAGETVADLPTTLPTMLSASDLARHINQPLDRVESFLRRYRGGNGDCFIKVDSPRKNEPRYLYRTADVWPALQAQLPKWRELTDD